MADRLKARPNDSMQYTQPDEHAPGPEENKIPKPWWDNEDPTIIYIRRGRYSRIEKKRRKKNETDPDGRQIRGPPKFKSTGVP
jgi:hypothetical protein